MPCAGRQGLTEVSDEKCCRVREGTCGGVEIVWAYFSHLRNCTTLTHPPTHPQQRRRERQVQTDKHTYPSTLTQAHIHTHSLSFSLSPSLSHTYTHLGMSQEHEYAYGGGGSNARLRRYDSASSHSSEGTQDNTSEYRARRELNDIHHQTQGYEQP